MVVDRENQRALALLAIFDVGIVAKWSELKRCADGVRSRTDNKDEILEGKNRNLNSLPSKKMTTEYSFEYSSIEYFEYSL